MLPFQAKEAFIRKRPETLLSGMSEPGDPSVMARRRSEEEIERVLEQYRASGLTQIEYCRQGEWS